LEFELRLQEYIELARAEKTFEALVYWKKHLQVWQDTHLVRMKQAAGLLNFSADTKLKTYQVDLLYLGFVLRGLILVLFYRDCTVTNGGVS